MDVQQLHHHHFVATALVRGAINGDPWALVADFHGCALWLPPTALDDVVWAPTPVRAAPDGPPLPLMPTQLELAALRPFREG